MNKSIINSSVFLFVFLGALSAFGPFVTDMYLPTLPSMADYFGTNPSMVQLGLTAGLVGLAAGQLFFGPLSDKYGRRPLLLTAMSVFIVSTVLCVFSPTIEVFVALRLVQGIAGAGSIVISRSVATDKFSGKELAKAMAIIGAINGVAPVAAPVVGGFFTDLIGWRGIFLILLGIGVVLLAATFRFRESLPAERRKRGSVFRMMSVFAAVLRNKRFVFYMLQMGFAMGLLFANIASSPFIMQEHYGFSALAFSVIFGVNSLAIALAAGISVKFRCPEFGTFWGSAGLFVFSLLELAALSAGCGFAVYEALLLLLMFSLGLTFTSTTTLAMDCERENSGTASALFGALGFAAGGVVSPIVGIGDILTTTGIAFAVCACGSLLFALCAVSGSVSLKSCMQPVLRIVRKGGK